MLSDRGITKPEELPQTRVSGVVEEIRTAVLDGNTYYFLRLADGEVFYSISAAQNRDVVTLNVGDIVTIDHALPAEGSTPSILDGYTLTIDKRGEVPKQNVPPSFYYQSSLGALEQAPVISGSGLPFHFQTAQAEGAAPVDPASITVIPNP